MDKPTPAQDDIRLPYLPGLDGLRGFAVLGVLLYHANLSGVRGGFLGVEIFFVISGYLITSLLLAEWRATNQFDLRRFWLRRARRLMPALALLIVAAYGFTILARPGELGELHDYSLAAAAFVTNWHLILSHTSYFEQVKRTELLQHLWSLAVEEQFYLLWPLLLGLGLKLLRRRTLVLLVILGAVVSALLMAALYQPDSDPSRVYYGTDTRASALLLGAGFALLFPIGRRNSVRRFWQMQALDGLGLVALTWLIVCFAQLDEFHANLYRGGFTAATLATLLVIAAVAQPGCSWTAALLSWAPLRWVGQRSYGIYLWHWPILVVVQPDNDSAGGVAALIGCVAAILLIADFSYAFVEMPLRKGTFAWPRARPVRAMIVRVTAIGSSVLLTLGLLAMGTHANLAIRDQLVEIVAIGQHFLHAPKAVSAKAPPPLQVASLSATLVPIPPTSLVRTSASTSTPLISPTLAATDVPVPTILLTATMPPTATPASHGPIVAIGDSVMLGAEPELARTFQSIEVDAKVNRRLVAGIAILQARRVAGQLGDTVIIHIGTNGPINREEFDALMPILADVRRVVIVNVKVARWWEGPNNDVLADGVRRYPNTVLADWYATSHDHDEFFRRDGFHLLPAGARVYATFLASHITSNE